MFSFLILFRIGLTKFHTEIVKLVTAEVSECVTSSESALNSKSGGSYNRYFFIYSNEETHIHFLGSTSTKDVSTLS